MAANEVYTSKQYRLRAGEPMPITGGGFKLHTFMAEESDVYNYPCTDSLPGSEEFRGQGGNYISAQFSRLQVKGGNYFQGKIVNNPKYIEEDALGFNLGG